MRNFLKRCCIRIGLIKRKRPSQRTVYVGHQPLSHEDPVVEDPEEFPDNEIVSYRYTIYNFLPKNLFEQFQRIANFYFLCIVIIQLFIDMNPTGRIIPLAIVISITCIKQGYEDLLRHRADDVVNNTPTEVIQDGHVVSVKSREIRVGDIVRCRSDEVFPCDLVMLSSSEPSGKCYVTTASLDGETNLKNFYAVEELKHLISPQDISQKVKALILCEQPQDDLYKFLGQITVNKGPVASNKIIKPLSAENLLLRGARLKNTDFVYGCAVYTGQDTKMALNSMGKVSKFSQVERQLNYFLIVYLCSLFVVSIFCTVMKWIYSIHIITVKEAWYLSTENSSAWRVVQDLLGFIVLFNYLIPISLYVTIEFQKFFGSIFFDKDLEMYFEEGDTPAKANTSDLNEELGEVEYLFSDKTGTLTENDMQFRRCFIHSRSYRDINGVLHNDDDRSEPQPVIDLSNEVLEFLTVLALCHTVRVERKGAYSAIPGEVVKNGGKDNPASSFEEANIDGSDYDYQASSPDEKAFVEIARRYGIVYHGTIDSGEHVITFFGNKRYFRVLQVLEFDSDRKCMSVIMQYDDGSIHLHCKGAETSILPKVMPHCPVSKDVIMNSVTDYAREGLRTLVFGTRELSRSEFEDMQHRLNQAQMSLQDREGKVSAAFAHVEQNLRLLGCTGIEDRLQEGVKESIIDLRQAGIQVWILTGDKEETAVNISHSAGHISQGMEEVRITRHAELNSCKRALDTQLEGVRVDKSKEFALVIDGQSLAFAFKKPLRNALVELCMLAATVLCCRMTPLQKAEVVNLIKTSVKPTPVTAAVGDGANDVSMILAAHVGIGLFGKEGRQAVRAADYAVARFKYLRRAFLYHGHLYYIRIANLVQYFFYKNVVFITAQLYYSFFCAFSAQTIYHSLYLLLYNLTFTSLPILIYGIFEIHLSEKRLMEEPSLYKKIARNSYLSWKQFLLWNLFGFWHSIVSFFGVYAIYSNQDTLSPDGTNSDLFSMGTLILIVVVTIVTLKLLFITRNFNRFLFRGILITLLGNLFIVLLANGIIIPKFENDDLLWVWFRIFSRPSNWLAIILIITLALTPDFAYKAWQESELDESLRLRKERVAGKLQSEGDIALRNMNDHDSSQTRPNKSRQ